MGDGFTANPDTMLSYAGQLAQYQNEIGVADNAAGTVLNENAGKLGPVTDELTKLGVTRTGQLDRAYGALCQPYGVQLQNMQQPVVRAVSAVAQLMARLRGNLEQCANNYRAADLRATSEIRKPMAELGGLDPVIRINSGAAPATASAPSGTSPVPPEPPKVPGLPGGGPRP